MPAFGSDAPVETLSPLAGIHAALTRQDAQGRPDGGWYPEERITIHEAIQAYTLGAAYASHEETQRGSIELGKFADLVVLDRDIVSTPPSEILRTRVLMTLVNGEIAFDAR